MQTLTLNAPAKINLYLNVLEKRADGFHNIETIFEKITLYDKLIFRKRKSGIKVFCRHRDVPLGKNNLAYQAAQALLRSAQRAEGVEIEIIKRIPVAAGLGGGSSDAAGVLLGLNKLLNCQLNQDELLRIAERLGADVPLFIFPYSRALGQGKGELLSNLKVKRRNWYILVVPPLKVSTRKMYQDPKIALTKRPPGAKIVIRSLEKGNLASVNKYSYNSFEPILTKKYKQVLEIKKALKSSGVCATLMSGSGPSVFGIAQTRKEAIAVGNKIKAKGRQWQVIVSQTVKDT